MRSWPPVVVLLAACGSPAAPPARAAVRDSAGITIVENAGPLAPDSIAFPVDSVPAVEIGGTGDRHAEFGRVAGAARLRGGAIVVADGDNHELRWFDSTGAWLRTVGRKGGGPGEFDMIGAVLRLGSDSLAIYDINHRRISVFGPDGSLAREMTLPMAPEDGFPFVVGVLRGDLLIQTEEFSQSRESGPRRDTVPVLRYPRWAAPSIPLGRFPGHETYLSVQRNSSGLITSTINTALPFGKMLTLVAAGDRLHVGSADRSEIASYDSAGRLTRLMRWNRPPEPVTDADVVAIKQEMLAGFGPGSEAMRDRAKVILEGMTFPSTKPPYEGFVTGDDGRLWVRQYGQPVTNRPVRYDVFDPDGQWLGHVTFPPRFALYQAGEAFALGVWTDADDVERVRLYHLRPVQ